MNQWGTRQRKAESRNHEISEKHEEKKLKAKE